jgi:wyosine [tRNA(Phe)-imidazoG37] synthetase (radical SAM superfamily)
MIMDLQSGIVYGPLRSRRLGRSLGVNLGPAGRKTCNFNCAYCEYGWTDFPAGGAFPDWRDVIEAVDGALAADAAVDAITVAGNGEPTLHPAFARIVEGLVDVRNRRAPDAKLALLSNGSTLHRLDVLYSLAAFDTRCMKLDAGDATTYRLMNAAPVPLARLINDLRSVGQLTLQSMFVRDADGLIDNTTPRALHAWLGAVDRVRPASVDVYTIARRPARTTLVAVPRSALEAIAERVMAIGIPARVFA